MSGKEKYSKPVQPADPNAEYLTVQETAWVLKCSVSWLRKGVNKHGFPHSTNGRRLVFNRADRAHIYAINRVPPQPIKRTTTRRTRKTAAKKPTAQQPVQSAA